MTSVNILVAWDFFFSLVLREAFWESKQIFKALSYNYIIYYSYKVVTHDYLTLGTLQFDTSVTTLFIYRVIIFLCRSLYLCVIK